MPVRSVLPVLALVLGVVAAPVSAASIDFSGAVNADLNNTGNYTAGNLYPVGGSTISVGGESFTLTAFGADGHTGVVAAGFPDGQITSAQINTGNLTGIGYLDILINAAFPTIAPTAIGNITFSFASGPDYVYDLVTSVNVRDHVASPSAFAQDNPAAIGEATWSNADFTVRLDAIRVTLPLAYAGDTLTAITLNNTFVEGGSPFIAAINYGVAAVPEPASWALMILGFGVAGAGLRRRPARVTA